MKKPDWTRDVNDFIKVDKTSNNCQWLLGDILLKAMGNPQVAGSQGDGSSHEFKRFSEELKQNGVEYEPLSLKNLRFAAYRFPPSKRRQGISWHCHYLAQDPETLESIIASMHGRNKNITTTYVLSVLRGRALKRQEELQAETERRRKEYQAAKREREEHEEAERNAKTLADRRAANERAQAAAARQKKHFTPPKLSDLPPTTIKTEDVPVLQARAAFIRDLGLAKRTVEKLRETYEAFIPSFTDADIENGHEELMAIAEAARAFAERLKKSTGKSSHLTVVGNVG